MKYPYYIEWTGGETVGRAVVMASDIAQAIESVTEESKFANFSTITVVGRIEGVKILDEGGSF